MRNFRKEFCNLDSNPAPNLFRKAILAYDPICSIIIINAKGTRSLYGCIDSIRKTTSKFPYEIMVVDSLSPLDDIEDIKDKCPDVTLMHFDSDDGASAAHNAGARLVHDSSKYLVFLDSDIEVGPGWLDPLIQTLENDLSCGEVQGKIYSLADRDRFDSTGHFVDRFGFALNRGDGEKDVGQYDERSAIDSARGACFATRKDVYFEIGGYDEDFFIYCDDIDYGWRLNLAGFKALYVPNSRVYHKGMVSPLFHRNANVVFHETKNRYIMIIKNHKSLPYALILLPWVCIRDLQDITLFLNKGLGTLALSKVEGTLWVFRNMRRILRKRVRSLQMIQFRRPIQQ